MERKGESKLLLVWGPS